LLTDAVEEQCAWLGFAFEDWALDLCLCRATANAIPGP